MTTTIPVYVNDLKIGGYDDNIIQTDLDKLMFLIYDKVAKKDNIVIKQIDEFEKKWSITIPNDLKTFICWQNIGSKIFHAFPTNNCLIVPGYTIWSDEKQPRVWIPLINNHVFQLPKKYMIRIMDENQGCCFWYSGCDDGINTVQFMYHNWFYLKLVI